MIFSQTAGPVLRYIELYTKIAVMKDMILQETAALMPHELTPNRDALLTTQEELRNTQKRLLKFLYESNLSNNVIPFFDPDVNPVTDAYLNTILKVTNYDRSLAGSNMVLNARYYGSTRHTINMVGKRKLLGERWSPICNPWE